jgi:hypothetical protein
MNTKGATLFDSASSYHEAACSVLNEISKLCGELSLLRITVHSRVLQKHNVAAGSAQWWLGKFDSDDDNTECTAAILCEVKERLVELKQLLHSLKKFDCVLATFAGSPCSFLMRAARGKGVPACLAGKFVSDLRQNPRARYHAALIDLATGCLDELSTAVTDPKAAEMAAAQWSEAFYRVGGSWQQWILALRAEKARVKEALEELTEDEKCQKFCFEKWQEGWSHKEINTALKKRPVWEHYHDPKAVRGPIKAWSKRIGVEPRRGQPGRRKSIEKLALR